MRPEETAFAFYTSKNPRYHLDNEQERIRKERYIEWWKKEQQRERDGKDKPTSAEVYLIQSCCPCIKHLFKIGVTTRGVAARIKDLITGTPFELKVIATVGVKPDSRFALLRYINSPLFASLFALLNPASFSY